MFRLVIFNDVFILLESTCLGEYRFGCALVVGMFCEECNLFERLVFHEQYDVLWS